MIVIVNPAAAGGRLGREWPRLAARLGALGDPARVVYTEAPGHATELAAGAVAAGAERVVVAGGDGTLCEAAEGLHRAGRGSLGILPLGTGNDIARTFGLPLETAAAARVAADGHLRAVDLIRVGDRVVVNAIGVGLTGDINRRAAKVKWTRGIAAYLVTALVSLVRFEAPRVRLTTPQLEIEDEMTLLAVHNGPTTGGGFRLTPAAEPADGLLDAAFVAGIPLLGRVPRLLAAMRGTLGRLPGTTELQAPWLELEFEVPLPAHLDGNGVLLEPPRVRFEILPGALSLAAPPLSTR